MRTRHALRLLLAALLLAPGLMACDRDKERARESSGAWPLGQDDSARRQRPPGPLANYSAKERRAILYLLCGWEPKPGPDGQLECPRCFHGGEGGSWQLQAAIPGDWSGSGQRELLALLGGCAPPEDHPEQAVQMGSLALLRQGEQGWHKISTRTTPAPVRVCIPEQGVLVCTDADERRHRVQFGEDGTIYLQTLTD